MEHPERLCGVVEGLQQAQHPPVKVESEITLQPNVQRDLSSVPQCTGAVTSVCACTVINAGGSMHNQVKSEPGYNIQNSGIDTKWVNTGHVWNWNDPARSYREDGYFAHGHFPCGGFAHGHFPYEGFAHGHFPCEGFAHGSFARGDFAHGHFPYEDFAHGHLSIEDFANGHLSSGDFAHGHLSSGDFAHGHLHYGDFPHGHQPRGNFAHGHFPSRDFAHGPFSYGDFANSHHARGDFAYNHFSCGDFAHGPVARGDFAHGPVARGDFAHGPVARGDFAKSRIARSHFAHGELTEMTRSGCGHGEFAPGDFSLKYETYLHTAFTDPEKTCVATNKTQYVNVDTEWSGHNSHSGLRAAVQPQSTTLLGLDLTAFQADKSDVNSSYKAEQGLELQSPYCTDVNPTDHATIGTVPDLNSSYKTGLELQSPYCTKVNPTDHATIGTVPDLNSSYKTGLELQSPYCTEGNPTDHATIGTVPDLNSYKTGLELQPPYCTEGNPTDHATISTVYSGVKLDPQSPHDSAVNSLVCAATDTVNSTSGTMCKGVTPDPDLPFKAEVCVDIKMELERLLDAGLGAGEHSHSSVSDEMEAKQEMRAERMEVYTPRGQSDGAVTQEHARSESKEFQCVRTDGAVTQEHARSESKEFQCVRTDGAVTQEHARSESKEFQCVRTDGAVTQEHAHDGTFCSPGIDVTAEHQTAQEESHAPRRVDVRGQANDGNKSLPSPLLADHSVTTKAAAQSRERPFVCGDTGSPRNEKKTTRLAQHVAEHRKRKRNENRTNKNAKKPAHHFGGKLGHLHTDVDTVEHPHPEKPARGLGAASEHPYAEKPALDKSAGLNMETPLHRWGEKSERLTRAQCSIEMLQGLDREKRAYLLEKMFLCEMCGGQFTFRSSLRKHFHVAHHRDQEGADPDPEHGRLPQQDKAHAGSRSLSDDERQDKAHVTSRSLSDDERQDKAHAGSRSLSDDERQDKAHVTSRSLSDDERQDKAHAGSRSLSDDERQDKAHAGSRSLSDDERQDKAHAGSRSLSDDKRQDKAHAGSKSLSDDKRQDKAHAGSRSLSDDKRQDKAHAGSRSLSDDERQDEAHASKRLFPCSYCGQLFTFKGNLYRHVLNVHEFEKRRPSPRMYMCDLCGKSFAKLDYLKEHLHTHSGERPFLCPTCGHTFTQARHLRKHRLRHDQSESGTVHCTRLLAGSTGPFVCNVCQAKFAKSRSLLEHTKMHEVEENKPYVCQLCSDSFTRPSHFKRHLRAHEVNRPFVCHFCKDTFVKPSHLKRHLLTHTGERPFRCKCGSSFMRNHHLTQHAQTCRCDQIRTYVCDACDGLAITGLADWKIHRRNHKKEALAVEVASQ